MLSRFTMLAFLDVAMSIFITLKTSPQTNYPHSEANLTLAYTLLGLLLTFTIVVFLYGVWRWAQLKRKEEAEVSGYICTIYEGANENHPERTTVYVTAFMFRQGVFAATVIYLYEEPVF